ncbi:MAG: acetyl-CoA decarbonylase/synthase complex subunit gamma [Chitinivibrionales bacterium]|nr:acetyl-CoA decarbonylase/synthase complex subunit gamma [Chitinivibrionales bacterium]
MAALTGMQIYKNLPRSNCKECGFPTCMAFAMQVAAKQKALGDCPRITDDAKNSLADASSPPMKLVTIGPEGKQFTFGQETVMFRHEERFHHATGVAVRIRGALTEMQVDELVAAINRADFMRAGEKLAVALCAVEVDGYADPAGRVQRIAQNCRVPLILMGDNPETLCATAQAIPGQRPLLCKATPANVEFLAKLAAGAKCALAIGAGTLEELADATQKAKANCVDDLVLAFSDKNTSETIRQLTIARRAAIKKNFRALGYPALVEVNADSPEAETVLAATFAAKYAGIVVINGHEPWELLPVLTTIQSIYTNPQVPNAVEAKLYAIGSVTENSPVIVTTNFSLTYFSVAGEVERSKIPCYISVVNTEGLGVLNSYAGDKISPEKVLKTLQEQKVAEHVKHRKLIIPGLLPIFKGELEDISEWKEVIIGPESASKIPAFLNSVWK